MRISLVTETFVPEINGVAKTLDRLVNELGDRGHNIHIIRPKQQTEHNNSRFFHTTVKGLPIPGYSGLQFGLPSQRTLKKVWLKQNPDIIYVATEGPLGWSAIRTANKLGIPVLSGFHTNFHTYSKHYNIGWLEKIIFAYLKNLHNKTLCTLAPSPELVADLKSRGINNVALFTRGVDTETYNPKHRNHQLREDLKIKKDAPVALYVGRIAAEKNIDLVIKSYQQMKKQAPGLRLIMVGDGPLHEKLHKLYPEIIFTGSKVGLELSQLYATADIFLFASETETFGNVILEAMSSELAVVAYDYAASRMHITHEQNGLIAEYGNPSKFTHIAVELIKQPEKIARLRKQARIKAEQTDWENVIDNFENLLVKYVKSKPHSSRESEEPLSADGSA